MRIAILEDEPAQQLLLQRTLEQYLVDDTGEFVCHLFCDGEALRRALRRDTFDLLVIDWNVPGIDGLELVTWLRTWQNNPVPILVLSSRTSELDVSRALMAGADDYVTKPFRRLELRARILKLLRRSSSAAGSSSQRDRFGRWRFNKFKQAVELYETVDPDSPLLEQHVLSPRQFMLTWVLFSNMGKTVSRAHLLELAGYSPDDVTGRALDSHIYRLRKDLGLEASRGVILRTYYGRGYRLEDCSQQLDIED